MPSCYCLGAFRWPARRSRSSTSRGGGAFFGTRLEQHLRGLTVSTLVFAGCNFPNCPRASIYEASERDFRIVVIEDALSGFYDRGRTELENIGVRVLDTESFLREAV